MLTKTMQLANHEGMVLSTKSSVVMMYGFLAISPAAINISPVLAAMGI